MPEAKQLILIKYGGNAMNSSVVRNAVLSEIAVLKMNGYKPIIVHGGGPFIAQLLDMAGIKSSFLDGQRITTPEAMRYVEMALKGQVNSELVTQLNIQGLKAVGLSGKDAGMVSAKKRSNQKDIDFGQVGNVEKVDTSILRHLLQHDYTPVIAPIALGRDSKTYNINADIFAGHIAAALNVVHFISLTDVDGLYQEHTNSASLINELTLTEIQKIHPKLQGGMLPKVDAVITALEAGVRKCVFLNGNNAENIRSYFAGRPVGTLFIKGNN